MTTQNAELPQELRDEFANYMYDCGLTFTAAAREMRCQGQNLSQIIQKGKRCSKLMHFKVKKYLDMMKIKEKEF